MQAGIRKLTRAAALLAVCSSSYAFAGTMVYPGVNCSSSGVVSKPINGSLMNAQQTAGTSKYHCPAIRTRSSNSTPYTVTATVHVLRNITGTDVNCALRVMDKLGNVIEGESAPIPHWNDVNSPKTFSRIITVPVVAPALIRSYSLRCDIPNVEGGEYGVISYEIND